jgi:hypothetical protein
MVFCGQTCPESFQVEQISLLHDVCDSGLGSDVDCVYDFTSLAGQVPKLKLLMAN